MYVCMYIYIYIYTYTYTYTDIHRYTDIHILSSPSPFGSLRRKRPRLEVGDEVAASYILLIIYYR